MYEVYEDAIARTDAQGKPYEMNATVFVVGRHLPDQAWEDYALFYDWDAADAYARFLNQKAEPMPSKQQIVAKLKQLGKMALPKDDADWGSIRQIDAQNAFTNYAEGFLTERELAEVWHKATTEEGVAGTIAAAERKLLDPQTFVVVKIDHDECLHQVFGPFAGILEGKDALEQQAKKAKKSYVGCSIEWEDERRLMFVMTTPDGHGGHDAFAEYHLKPLEKE